MSKDDNDAYKGIYSRIRVKGDLELISEIKKLPKLLEKKLLGKVTDLGTLQNSKIAEKFRKIPQLNLNLLEDIDNIITSNLFNRKKDVDAFTQIKNLKPIVNFKEINLDKEIKPDYLASLFDEYNTKIQYQKFDQKHISNITSLQSKININIKNIDITSVKNLDVLKKEVKFIKNIPKIFDKEKEILFGSENVKQDVIYKYTTKEAKEIRSILHKIEDVKLFYHKIYVSYIMARFPIPQQSSTINDYLKEYQNIITGPKSKSINNLLKDINENKLIEKLKKYQDKHILKGKKDEFNRFLPLQNNDNDNRDKEFDKIVNEEREFLIKLYNLENINIKNYESSNTTENVADILRNKFTIKRFENSLTDEKKINEEGTSGFIKPIGDNFINFNDEIHLAFFPSYALEDKSIMKRKLKANVVGKMVIDSKILVGSIRRTVRHEFIHSINTITKDFDEQVENLRIKVLNEQIVPKIDEITDRIQVYIKDLTSDNMSSNTKSLFQIKDKDDIDIVTNELEATVDKLNITKTYIKGAADFLNFNLNTSFKNPDNNRGHGQQFSDLLKLSEGNDVSNYIPRTDSLSPSIGNDENFQNNKFTFYPGNSKIQTLFTNTIDNAHHGTLIYRPNSTEKWLSMKSKLSNLLDYSYWENKNKTLEEYDTFLDNITEKGLDMDKIDSTISSINKKLPKLAIKDPNDDSDDSDDSYNFGDFGDLDDLDDTGLQTEPLICPPTGNKPKRMSCHERRLKNQEKLKRRKLYKDFEVFRPISLRIALNKRIVFLNEVDIVGLFRLERDTNKIINELMA